MPAPTNTSALTATNITALPYSVTQNVHDAGTTYTVWYKWTATATEELSIFPFGVAGAGYNPGVKCYTGPAAAPTPYLITSVSPNFAVQIPVVSGTTYYFEFVTNSAVVTPANLILLVQLFAPQAVPFGSIVVNDDQDAFPAVLIHPTTGAIVRFVQGVPFGECADVLDNGYCAFGDILTGNVAIYSPNLSTVVATVTADVDCSHGGTIRTCLGSGQWWVSERTGGGAGPINVRSLTQAGTLGTAHSITGTIRADAIAASNDETVLYYVRTTVGQRQVRRWDLVNDLALSDFAAEVADYHTWDILVLRDDSVLVSYINQAGGSEDFYVVRYSDAGAVLNTYNFGSAMVFPNSTNPRIAYGTNDTSFWAWWHPDGANEGTSRFQCVQLSDGTVLSTANTREYELGTYQGTETATPDFYFGNPYSCPFLLLRTSLPGPGGGNTDLDGPTGLTTLRDNGRLRTLPIRRRRTGPLLMDRHQRMFFSRFELFYQPGLDIPTTGQGSDPLIALDWTNDAQTWAEPRILQQGASGQYLSRAYAYQLGMARQRAFRVTQTDPVPTVWIGADLEIEEGTS